MVICYLVFMLWFDCIVLCSVCCYSCLLVLIVCCVFAGIVLVSLG